MQGGGGWPDQMGIRLTSASTGVGVEVGAELGNNYMFSHIFEFFL